MKLTIKVRGEKAQVIIVASYTEASRLTREAIEVAGVGGSGFGGATLRSNDGKKLVGHVSYNGRVWEGTSRTWTPTTKLLLEAGPSERHNARAAFIALAREIGSSPIAEENAILSIGRELLPAFALPVLDGDSDGSTEYWQWLLKQAQQAQAEHDAEVAAGHEWHDGEVR